MPIRKATGLRMGVSTFATVGRNAHFSDEGFRIPLAMSVAGLRGRGFGVSPRSGEPLQRGQLLH